MALPSKLSITTLQLPTVPVLQSYAGRVSVLMVMFRHMEYQDQIFALRKLGGIKDLPLANCPLFTSQKSSLGGVLIHLVEIITIAICLATNSTLAMKTWSHLDTAGWRWLQPQLATSSGASAFKGPDPIREGSEKHIAGFSSLFSVRLFESLPLAFHQFRFSVDVDADQVLHYHSHQTLLTFPLHTSIPHLVPRSCQE